MFKRAIELPRESANSTAADGAALYIPVWDPLIRVLHWSVAGACLIDQFWLDDGNRIHRWLGYYVAAAVLVRIIWGFFGPPYARFVGFVPTPRAASKYLQALVRGQEPRHIGHNPLGALMILFFLALLLAICFTGWLQGTDRFFGIDWVERTHELLSDALVVALLVHVAGSIAASIRHHENLIWAMVTGRKRAARS